MALWTLQNGAMEDAERGQVAAEAAAVYEEFFVPALFGQWPTRLLDAAGVASGHQVLDVGCGTGVLARAAVDRVGDGGSVTGVDPNPGMLSVARRHQGIEWTSGQAEQLPCEDSSFDRALSQFALMFFTDRSAAVKEMRRVLRPGGTVAVATWASLAETPGYAAMVELLDDLFGEAAAAALRAPYVLGDPAEVQRLLSAEFDDVTVKTHDGVARFDSIESWVHTDIRGWTLADAIDDDQYEELLTAAQRDLTGFTTDTGAVEFPAPALIATATRND